MWRQLEKNRSKLVCLPHRLEGANKIRCLAGCVAKAHEVRDPLVRFEGKFEIRWSRLDPTLEQLLRGKAAKRMVHLDRVQPRWVVAPGTWRQGNFAG